MKQVLAVLALSVLVVGCKCADKKDGNMPKKMSQQQSNANKQTAKQARPSSDY